MINIVMKINNDGFLEFLREAFGKIIDNEIEFAIRRLTEHNGKKDKESLCEQINKNTIIFKENLKIITGNLIETIWNEKVDKV